ncbi:hypothetical protein COX97_02070 [Candidatus Pacearchaeota archaeon CG_4_10_14_0_2_um_filter_05_32_18]|nr:MAG: hypothetical protein COX97_02070 [Candidatus Pacearchaeota archaeon CG_4_10_14_0_2_um_filter_05_32_18]
MKDVNATIIINLEGKNEEEIWRNVKYSRRKYVQQAQKSKLHYDMAFSEKDLKEMYEMHMQTLEEGGAVKWTYEKWRDFVLSAGEKFFYIKKGNEIIGCFALGEITERLYGKESDKKGIRPLVFANKKEYNELRPNDYMYWESIKYALINSYSFIDLGGWQINARGHLKNVNQFKEQWGGEIVYYDLDYPFLTAIRRKLIRKYSIFWQINTFIKKSFGKIGKSAHDDIIKNATARNLTSSSST